MFWNILFLSLESVKIDLNWLKLNPLFLFNAILNDKLLFPFFSSPTFVPISIILSKDAFVTIAEICSLDISFPFSSYLTFVVIVWIPFLPSCETLVVPTYNSLLFLYLVVYSNSSFATIISSLHFPLRTIF